MNHKFKRTFQKFSKFNSLNLFINFKINLVNHIIKNNLTEKVVRIKFDLVNH